MKNKWLLTLFLLVCAGSLHAQQVVNISSGTLTLDLRPGLGVPSFKVPLNQNVTTLNLLNPTGGMVLTIMFVQDATGGRTVAFGSSVANACSLNSAANSATVCAFMYDAIALQWTGIGAAGGSAANALNNNAWYVSQSCGSATNCTQVFADTKYVIDATSNSSTTITCPNNDCNFTQADVGKKVWATTQGTNQGFLSLTTFVCPVATINTVNGAQSITVSVACTANGTANVVLIWGHDDGAALASLDAAVGCATVNLPGTGSFIMTSQPFLVNAPSSTLCNQQLTTIMGNPAPNLIGAGQGASSGSTIVMTPDFNWANCKAITGASKNVCIGGRADILSGFGVWGTGLTSASNSGCSTATNNIVVSASPVASVIYGVFINGVCPGASGLIGVESNSFDEVMEEGGAQMTGTIACNFHGAKGMSTRGEDCQNGLITNGIGYNVEAGAQVQDFNTYPIVNGVVAGNFQSHNTHFFGGVSSGTQTGLTINAGGVWTSDGDFVGVDAGSGGATTTLGAFINQGAGAATFAYSRNTQFAASGGGDAIRNAAGTFIDQGGNLITSGNAGLAFGTPNAQWRGQQVLSGSCTGTATASSTLGFYGLGENSAITCTSTTVSLGVPLTSTGTVRGVLVYAGTGGVNASSGVVTVLKNGGATTMTCTLGTGTGCLDSTHTFSYAQGDIISVQFTTQAAETLANLKVMLLAW